MATNFIRSSAISSLRRNPAAVLGTSSMGISPSSSDKFDDNKIGFERVDMTPTMKNNSGQQFHDLVMTFGLRHFRGILSAVAPDLWIGSDSGKNPAEMAQAK